MNADERPIDLTQLGKNQIKQDKLAADKAFSNTHTHSVNLDFYQDLREIQPTPNEYAQYKIEEFGGCATTAKIGCFGQNSIFSAR